MWVKCTQEDKSPLESLNFVYLGSMVTGDWDLKPEMNLRRTLAQETTLAALQHLIISQDAAPDLQLLTLVLPALRLGDKATE